MKFFWNPNISVHWCLIQNLFFFCPLLSKDISNTRSGLSKWCRLPPLPFKISLKDTFFHIYLNSFGLYLSPECLLTFLSNLYIQPWLGKIFKFMVFIFLEYLLNLDIFTLFPIKVERNYSSSPCSYSSVYNISII